MDATLWLQATANGLALGWLYLIMALGLTFILGILHVLQFAHGEVYMLGAYIVYYLPVSFGINIYLAILLSMVIMGIFGIVIERLIFRPVAGKDMPSIVVSLALSMFLVSFAVVAFGIYERIIPKLAFGSFYIFESAVPKDRVIAVALSVALLLVVYLFLKKTQYGQAMVASAQNRETALLRGIDPNVMSRLAFIIASALAAAGGAMAGSILMLQTSMGGMPMLKGLIIIVVGGMGSIPGAAIAGMILGLLDGILPVVADPAVATVIPFVFVIILLMVRPQGLFGHA